MRKGQVIGLRSKGNSATLVRKTLRKAENTQQQRPAKKPKRKVVLDIAEEDEDELPRSGHTSLEKQHSIQIQIDEDDELEEGQWMCTECEDLQDEDDSHCEVCGQAKGFQLVEVSLAETQRATSVSFPQPSATIGDPVVSIPVYARPVGGAPGGRSPSVSLGGASFISHVVNAEQSDVLECMTQWAMDARDLTLDRLHVMSDHVAFLMKEKHRQIQKVKMKQEAEMERLEVETRRKEEAQAQARKVLAKSNKDTAKPELKRKVRPERAPQKKVKPKVESKKERQEKTKKKKNGEPEWNDLLSASLYLTGHSDLEVHIPEGGTILGRGDKKCNFPHETCATVSRKHYYITLGDDNCPVQATIRLCAGDKRESYLNDQLIGLDEIPIRTGDTIRFYDLPKRGTGGGMKVAMEWKVKWNREHANPLLLSAPLDSDSSEDADLAELMAKSKAARKKRKKSLPKKVPKKVSIGKNAKGKKPALKMRTVDVGSLARNRKQSSVSGKSQGSSGNVIVIDSDE